MKRLKLAVAVLFVLCMVFGRNFIAEAATVIDYGTCGTLHWVVEKHGSDDFRLEISGNGVMRDGTSAQDFPWYEYRDIVDLIIIEEGVQSIGQYAFATFSNAYQVMIRWRQEPIQVGNYAFENCQSLKWVDFSSVSSIGNYAFSRCNAIETMTIGDNCKYIGKYAFSDCSGLRSIYFSHTDAPVIEKNAFYNVNAHVSYSGNSTWTDSLKENCGTDLKWGERTGGLSSVCVYEVNEHETGNILYWNLVSDRDFYQVYRYRSGESSWVLLENTRGEAYKDETALPGVKYYYKILARNGDRKSDISKTTSVGATRPLPKVMIVDSIGHSTGNIIYWDAVLDASMYQIYRRAENETEYMSLAYTKSLGYKDTGASAGVQYAYKILAVNGEGKSSFDRAQTVLLTRGQKTKLGNVTITKTIGHSSGNIAYWDEVTNAQIYQVYRLRSGETTWTLLANTGGLGYKDTTALAGVRYYYKVIARNGDVKSDIATTGSVSIVRP